jgi:hypothetical protein
VERTQIQTKRQVIKMENTKTLSDYKQQKVDYLRSKLTYHRARLEEAVGEKAEHHQRKIDYAISKLQYMGVEV